MFWRIFLVRQTSQFGALIILLMCRFLEIFLPHSLTYSSSSCISITRLSFSFFSDVVFCFDDHFPSLIQGTQKTKSSTKYVASSKQLRTRNVQITIQIYTHVVCWTFSFVWCYLVKVYRSEDVISIPNDTNIRLS